MRGVRIFFFATASGPAHGPTQPPIQWLPGALTLRVKRPDHEADHSPPSSAKVKNSWSYISSSPIRLHGVALSYKNRKHRRNFNFYLLNVNKYVVVVVIIIIIIIIIIKEGGLLKLLVS
jgi:hypothetical protein